MKAQRYFRQDQKSSGHPVLTGTLLAGGLCLCVAAVISVYLGVQARGSEISGCSGTGSCNEVLNSRWSSVMGLPVGFIGAGLYLSLLLLASRIGKGGRGEIIAWSLMALIPLGALWFTGLQAFVIGSWCKWCCSIHALAVIGVIFIALHHKKRLTGFSRNTAFASLGLASVALASFSAVQAFSPYQEPSAIVLELDTAVEDSAALEIPSAGPRLLSLHDASITLDADALPILGSSKSENLCVALVSYGCGYCRKLLGVAEKAVAERGEETLGVVLLPIGKVGKAGENHRLLLATWKFAPETFDKLHQDLIGGRVAIKPEALREYIGNLESLDLLDASLKEHAVWIEEQLDLAQKLLVANHSKLEKSRLPHLMLGNRIIVGAPDEVEINSALTSVFGLEEREFSETLIAASPSPTVTQPIPELIQPQFDRVTANTVSPQKESLPLVRPARKSDSRQTPGLLRSTSKSAGLVFAEEQMDLGALSAGQAVPVTVNVTNPGEGRLLITGISRVPGCQVTSKLPLKIAPGESGEVTLQLTPPAQAGPFARKLKFTSNISGVSPSVTLLASVPR